MHTVSTFNGNIAIHKHNVRFWEKRLRLITDISGSLTIDANVTIKTIWSISGDCTTFDDSKVEMANLRTVGGELSLNGPTNLDELVTVGGDLCLRWGLKANKLFAIGGNLIIDNGYKFEAENLTYVGGALCIDGIIMKPYEAKLNRRMQTQVQRNNRTNYDAIMEKYAQVIGESSDGSMDMILF